MAWQFFFTLPVLHLPFFFCFLHFLAFHLSEHPPDGGGEGAGGDPLLAPKQKLDPYLLYKSAKSELEQQLHLSTTS